MTCAQWLWKKIIALYEQAAECDGEVVRPKEPNWTAWANEIRLMCVQDGRTHKQICEMYSRVSRDPFWCRNVLSPSKLREKWDELSLRLSPSVSTYTEKREDTRAYKIRFPNGTVDVFRGWVSSIGKAVTAKDVITRTVKVTNVGRPSMAEDRSTVTAATGMTVTPASASVVKGKSTTLTVAFQPEGATDKSFRAVSADKTKATVSVSGMTITVKGVAAGKVNIPVVSGNGELAAVAEINVTAS